MKNENMINHHAVSSISEEEAKKTFTDLFGLEMLYDFHLDSESSHTVFGVDKDLHVFIFEIDDNKIEVFIDPVRQKGTYEHLAFNINDKESLVKKARGLGFEVFYLEREGGRRVLFIRDGSDNLFEIK